jgi:hypothetical protein
MALGIIIRLSIAMTKEFKKMILMSMLVTAFLRGLSLLFLARTGRAFGDWAGIRIDSVLEGSVVVC